MEVSTLKGFGVLVLVLAVAMIVLGFVKPLIASTGLVKAA